MFLLAGGCFSPTLSAPKSGRIPSLEIHQMHFSENVAVFEYGNKSAVQTHLRHALTITRDTTAA